MTVNNRPAQPNTTNTTWGTKNVPPQNNSRSTPNTGNTPTNVYRPPPPKNPPSNAPVVALKQQPQQPAAKPDTTEPATTSMDVDSMIGDDDMAYFESEDDRWMLGDFEIDLDVDLGRPINFEGEESVANQDDSGFQDANCLTNVDPRKGDPPVLGPVAPAQRSAAVSVPADNNNAGLGPSANGDSNPAQRSGGSNPANPTSKGVTNPNRPANDTNQNGNGNHGNSNSFQPLPNVRSGGNGTTFENGINRGHLVNGSTGTGNGNGNGGRTNLSNSTSSAQTTGSGNNRPSAGGFTFAPGIVRVVLFSLPPHAHES